MQNKISKVINVILTIAIIALALNVYQMKQQLDDQITDSSKSIDKINASITATKVHEVELEAKDVAMSALLADLIIKIQEQGQSLDELSAKQTKKK
jgi:putative effector of murein hydrolase